MTAFVFLAVDAAGKPQKGVVEAANAAGARRLLRERALLPVSVEMGQGSAMLVAGGRARRNGLFSPRISSKVLAVLTRQLSTLIDSDVRVEEALRIVAGQATSTYAQGLLVSIRGAILEGRSFADALGDHPSAFPEFYRASVAAGERSGKLAEVLAHLSEFVEGRQRSGQKIQLALLYPALLTVASLGMITLMMIYVVPGVVKVFVSRGAELPLLTRGLILLSDAVRDYGLPAALAIIAASVGVRYWLRSPDNRLAVARFIARTPPMAGYSRQLNAARFAASLATLVQSDVPLVDALSAAAAVTPNAYVRQQALGVAARVREGVSLHRAMEEAGCFPPMLLAIVSSGESSGKLGKTLGKAAQDLEREVETLVATLVALVEPGVLLLMGGLVLLLVLSILLPIVNLSNLVGT